MSLWTFFHLLLKKSFAYRDFKSINSISRMRSNSAATLALSEECLRNLQVARSGSASSAPCSLISNCGASLSCFTLVAGIPVLCMAQQAYFYRSALLRGSVNQKYFVSAHAEAFLSSSYTSSLSSTAAATSLLFIVSFVPFMCVGIWS